MKKILVIFFAAVVLGACATKTVDLSETDALQKYQAVNDLNQLLGKAEAEDVMHLAPSGYRESKSIYEEALELAIKDKPEANPLAQTGLDQMKTALRNAQTSREIMRDVLDARDKAMIADAPSLYPKEFGKIESYLLDTTEDIEKGRLEAAKKLRADLIKEYADLELAALMKKTSQQAEAMLEQADDYGAERYAPRTFKLAEEELALALDVLSTGRTQTLKAREHADMSIYYSKKSMNITDLVREFDRRDYTDEDTLLWYQDQLELINKPLGGSLSLDQPNYDVVIGLQKQIQDLLQQITDNKNALVSASEKAEMLEARLRMVEAQYQSTDASMKQQLAEVQEQNRAAEARYNTIQQMFTEEEAQVFRQGNNVLLETHAFDFKVGASEIDSSNYGLLEKIMEAIKVFDNPDIVIMGHTDATGGDAVNMALSIRRAQTVASFLQKIGKFSSSRISYKGFGETRPVASNETLEGRERNRRIEVLIVNK